MTRKEWIYVGSAGVIALGGVLWFAHKQVANAAASQAAQDQAASAISSAMAGGGLSPYYGMSGGGSYIPEAGQATSTTPQSGGSQLNGQPTAGGSDPAAGNSSDPILGFLEAYMTSNASAQQSQLQNQVATLQQQLSQAQGSASQVSSLKSQLASLQQQYQSVYSSNAQLQSQYQSMVAGYNNYQAATVALKNEWNQEVGLLHQAQSSGGDVNKDALAAILNQPLPG